jgi:hypothetical protein
LVGISGRLPVGVAVNGSAVNVAVGTGMVAVNVAVAVSTGGREVAVSGGGMEVAVSGGGVIVVHELTIRRLTRSRNDKNFVFLIGSFSWDEHKTL